MHKGADMIAANRVGDGQGFETDDNELLLVWEGGERLLPRTTKARLAVQLLEQVANLYARRLSSDNETSQPYAKHSA